MASEAQRIMNLSVTKIVSSRGRRGGVSLHRNLLVASVLFKARDVYAAEMAGLVVIRNGSVYDRNCVPDERTDDVQEVPDLSDETDDNIIPDEQVQEAVNAIVVDPVLVGNPSPSNESVDDPVLVGTPSPSNESVESFEQDVDLDCGKENVEPKNSNTVKLLKRKLNPQTAQYRKRKYTEVEQAVRSITDQKDSGISTKKSRIEEENTSLNCNELSSNFLDWTADDTSVAGNQCNSDQSMDDYNSDSLLRSYSSYSYDDYDGGSNDDESSYHDVNSYQSSCHVDSCNSAAGDSISFALSHSVLVVSV